MTLDDLSDDELAHLDELGLIPEDELERLVHERIAPEDLAIIDAFAFGLAKLLHTPINQLVAEAAHERVMTAGWSSGPIVGSKAGAWANQATDYALNTEGSYIATAYLRPPPEQIYDPRSRWVVYAMTSRRDLDAWYQSVVATPSRYHFVAAFDKTAPEWSAGRPVATTAEPSAYTSGDGQKLDRDALASRSSAKEQDMYAYDNYVGADGQSYPEIASRAVQSVHQQSQSPVYGYLRTGAQQKIYLFGALDDAHGWITALIHGQAQPYDYAAVFAATDLTHPVAGLESFGHTTVSGDTTVGQIWPFILGLPLGGLAGYFLRKWQEGHPGQAIPGVPPGRLPAPNIPGPPPGGPSPKTSGDYAVGGPWLDIDPAYSVGGPWVDLVGCDYGEGYTVGGPWLDIVGAQGDDRARVRSWPQTKGLIQSAIKEVSDAASMTPGASAYVWSLDPPSSTPSYSPSGVVTLEGTTGIMSFNSVDEALDYMRERIHTPHVALALFDRRSPHWPNPTNWTKSNDPSYEPVIAQQAAKYAPARAAGDYVGAWSTTIGTALDDVRSRAQSIATKRDGRVIGVIHTSKDGLWHALAFHHADDADDWLGTATHDPAAYTYAAYYDKDDYSWPHPVNEKIGGPRTQWQPGEPIRRGPATTSGW